MNQMENKNIYGTVNDDVAMETESEAKAVSRENHSSHHHGHHHSHHSHHHSSHHKRRRSKSKKKKKALKVNKKAAWAIVVGLVVLFAVVAIVFGNDAGHGEHQFDVQTSDVLVVDVINEDGLLVKEAVEKYLLIDLLRAENAKIVPSSFSNGGGRLDVQVPVALRVSTKSGSGVFYKIELADNDLFQNAETSYILDNRGTYEFEHLYANTTYYYRVTVYTNSGSEYVVGHFKTADTPRILSIDGLYNVRDIGNWQTDSGKRIKQGLLIRGTEMDAAVETKYHLTSEGLIDMLEVFEIKTDIDLRAQTALSMDALGAQVEHNYYDMVMYGEIFTDYGKDKVREVFADLADPDNYPIYLHCTYGRDRTGTICYLLEAVLGVSRGDCLKDYALSDALVANIQAVENGLKAYKGNTLKEQAESYLLSCGVSEYQINSIREIFLGD